MVAIPGKKTKKLRPCRRGIGVWDPRKIRSGRNAGDGDHWYGVWKEWEKY